MKPAILMIDLQNDFLQSAYLEPAAGQVVSEATRLLSSGRRLSIPVVHIWTTVSSEEDRRMPHWKSAGKWACVEGSEGHATPGPLRPLSHENVIHKTFFSAFSVEALDRVLELLKVDTLLLAGVHLHGCIRTTALDAYQRGLRVLIVEDAVASDDPLHAAVSRRYLQRRGIRFITLDTLLSTLGNRTPYGTRTARCKHMLPATVISGVAEGSDGLGCIIHGSPRQSDETLWGVPICGQELVSRATGAAQEAWTQWRDSTISFRIGILKRMVSLLEKESYPLAKQMAMEIGKPLTHGRTEVARSVALLRSGMHLAKRPMEIRCSANSVMRYRPLGVIAIITPWNNPLAIPLGKIAPALLFGNTVVWKPAPAGASLALRAMELLREAGCPPGIVNLVCGDSSTALTLMSDGKVEGVTFSGSLAAGYSAQDICASRHIPLQAELGGNNAAIVWGDIDLKGVAPMVAEAAFGFAGQRCTANRRVIVDSRHYKKFLNYLASAVSRLACLDPLEDTTQVGPLISFDALRRIDAVVARAKEAKGLVLAPHNTDPDFIELRRRGAYYPPSIICCDEPDHEIVQEETFGPILVVQRARNWDHAIQLCNGVRQGLVAALFSSSSQFQKRFLEEAKSGVLKINMGTADANAEAPFGGWRASGIGPPEHGLSNREFYTRTQSVYR